MTEGQTLKPRSRLLAAVLAVALVVGMAPSFALIAPDEAYAQGDQLAPAKLTVQDIPDEATQAESPVNWASVYGGGYNKAITSDNRFSQSLINAFENAIVLNDGQVVAAGLYADTDAALDASLVYFDEDGNQVKGKDYLYKSTTYDGFEKVIKAKDGNFVAVGYVGTGDGTFKGFLSEKENPKNGEYDALICKISATDGTVMKAASFGGTVGGKGTDMFRDVIELDDGSFVAVGYEDSTDGDMQDVDTDKKTSTRDPLVVNFSPELSQRSIVDILTGSAKSMNEEARVVLKGPDGGFVIGGYAHSNDGAFKDKHKGGANKSDWFFATYNAKGERTGLTMYGGKNHDYLMGMDYDYFDANHNSHDTPQGYVLVGWGKSTDGDFECYRDSTGNHAALVRVGLDGKYLETVPLGSADESYVESVVSSKDGYLVAGSFKGTLNIGDSTLSPKGSEDVFTTFITPSASGYSYSSTNTFGGTGDDRVRSITVDSNANVLLTGTTGSDSFENARMPESTYKSLGFVLSAKGEKLMPNAAYVAAKNASAAHELAAKVAEAENTMFGHVEESKWADLWAAVDNARTILKSISAVTLDQIASAQAKVAMALDEVNAANKSPELANPSPTVSGEYALKMTAYIDSKFKTGTPTTFDMSRFFGKNYKLTRADSGKMTLTLRYSSTVDMQKIALDNVEATKKGVGPENADETCGSYLLEMPIDSINKDHVLAFTYDTGDPRFGAMTHEVHLVNMSTDRWSDFSDIATKLGSGATEYVAGTYSVPVEFWQEFENKTSMAAAAFNSVATVIVAKGGATTVKIGTRPLSYMNFTAYADNVTVYQGATASGAAAEAKEVATQKVTVGGEEVDVPTSLEFTVPEAAKGTDFVNLSLKSLGSPMGSAQNVRLKLSYAKLASASAASVDNATWLISWLSKDAGLSDEAAIKAAEEAYNALSAEERKSVPSDSVTLLTQAKASYVKAVADKAAAEKAAADKAAAEKAAAEKAAADKAAHTIKSVTVASSKATYTGSAITPQLTVKAQDGSTIAASGYTATWTNNVNAGTATVEVKGSGAFTGSAKATFTISPASISAAKVTLKKASADYTGKTQKGAVKSVMLGKSTLKSGKDYTVKAASGKKAGSYAVTVTGKGNYTGTKKATFTVTKVAASAKATTSKSYKVKALKKKAASFKAFTVKTDGKVTYKVAKADAKKVLSFKSGKVSVKKGAKAGTYSIQVRVSAKAGTNYTALEAKTYKVTVEVKK